MSATRSPAGAGWRSAAKKPSKPLFDSTESKGFANSPVPRSEIRSRKAALSRTVWLTTWPTLSPLQHSASVPSMVVSPRLGLRPKSPQFAAGMRIEPPPSLAWAAGTMPAATAAAAPPEEPPVECERCHGLRHAPVSTGSVVSVSPHSGVLVLPSMLRPEST